MRVRACGACRTDLHVVEGDLRPRRLPVIPGHQVVGIVDALGAGATRFRIGDRVGIAWLRSTCGHCRFCLSARENLCEDSTYTGWTHDGGYAEQACVPEAFAYAIPPAFDDAEATPLLCAGIIGYRALRRSQVPRGGRLGLYGFGSSAHITLQVARAWGCVVYVVTREPERRHLALELGAGFRAAAFLTAGIASVPFWKFVLTAGLTALLGVPFSFALAYFFTDHIKAIYADVHRIERWIGLVVVLVVAVAVFLSVRKRDRHMVEEVDGPARLPFAHLIRPFRHAPPRR